MTSIELHGFKLDLPDDHWLPQIRDQLPNYSENVGRIAAAVERKYPGQGFIDVGANVGDTAAIVRAHSNLPILCIEGSELYYELLERNIRQLKADVELEYALVDCASTERQGRLSVEHGTATFLPASSDGPMTRFAALDSILARHPRFQTAKILKIDTDGMDGRILEGALEWIHEARPVLFWEHDVGRDAAAHGPGLAIFDQLRERGYREALVFDNTGEFIENISLGDHQQLADLSDYLPGGDELYGYCDICAFHEEDLDLCSLLRRVELDNRRIRRKTSPKTLNEPLFRALMHSQFETFGAAITRAVERAIGQSIGSRQRRLDYALTSDRAQDEPSQTIANKTAELQALRAQMELERHRSRLQLTDLEKRRASKDGEIDKLHVLVRQLIAERAAEIRRETNAASGKENEALRVRLEDARNECTTLRHQLDTSLALRVARSFRWALGPIRKLIVGDSPPRGDRS